MPDETIAPPKTPPSDRLSPEFRDASATYRFDLTDGRSFMLVLDHGRPSLREGREEAECVFESSPEDLRRTLAGEENLLTALMRGDVHVQGNLASAKRLYRYLRLADGGGSRS